MNRARILLIVLGVLALVGGGTALASKGTSKSAPHRAASLAHGPRRAGELGAAAAYLDTTVAELVTQLRSGKTLAQIASSTSGKSASGLIAALVAEARQRLGSNAPADLEQRITDLVNGVHAGRGFAPGPGRGPFGAVTTYLGISPPALLTQLRAGKTLAQIANGTPGKSASGLIAALVAAAKQRFGSNLPPAFEQRITDLVNGVRPTGGPGGPGWGGPPGGPGHRGFRPPGSHNA